MPAMHDDFDDFDDTENLDPAEHDDDVAAAEAALAAAKQRAAHRGGGKKNRKNRRSGGKIPANAPRPQDRRESKAAQRDATGEKTFTLEFRGEDYTVPSNPEYWPTLAVQYLNVGRSADALELVLGSRQWAKFNRLNPLLRDFKEFAVQLGEEMGISLGN
ncbi:hypothetical protein EU244_033915 [Rhodococcus qingshengii]|uniref:hypothetical protein n=1 Tax=Rhodococcus qingshengii TaxID=334542 RepID=UPI0010A67FE9|nr:hypothetical protein [Rhodococcus qingshengii]THJ69475.1 hypothetical protein EU244_21175 [Rhodococcus qingshengii]